MQPGFWEDPKEAEKVLKLIRSKKVWTDEFGKIKTHFEDIETLLEFLEDGDGNENDIER